MQLKHRSYQKELLDADDLPFEDIRRNMYELNIINSFLGGHSITISAIKKLIRSHKKPEYIICEIGCGGCDNLLAIKKYFRQSNVKGHFIGIDINGHCISYARSCFGEDGEFIQSDYKDVVFKQKPDIIFNSLFCHHFREEAIAGILQWMQQHSALGFFINDLHRNTLAYYSIKLITGIFSKSYLVKHDAPLSVKRGFKAREWKSLLKLASIYSASVSWKWAFRWLVIVKHEQPVDSL